VLAFYPATSGAVVVVMVDVSLWWKLRLHRVVRRHFSHLALLRNAAADALPGGILTATTKPQIKSFGSSPAQLCATTAYQKHLSDAAVITTTMRSGHRPQGALRVSTR
jgi:hypothetical protein